MSDVEDRVDNASDGGDDDLFGDNDGSDASLIEENPPIGSDDDLASDNDRARRESASPRDDRSEMEGSAEPQSNLTRVLEMELQRHALPKTKDGNMQIAKVPDFLRFIPEPFDADTFEPSQWAIENSKRRIPTNLVRYRRNPETGKLESNANIYKWSDGSMTMQVGEEHYEIQVKAQVPPPNKTYLPDRDANRYVAAAHSAYGFMITVAHVTEEWAIRPDKQRVDEDTEKLKEQMGLAKGGAREGEMIITTTTDPELQKREAELAEKERAKAQRKRENAAMRMEGGPVSSYRKSGLNVDDLELGRRSKTGRKRGAGGSSQKKRRHDSSSDDEGRGPNNYDKEDDFIASSGEELAEDDDDDILDDGDVEFEHPRTKRQRTRSPDEEEDADGELDDDTPAAGGDHGRRRVRRVVSDDDDDE